jgi:hypothetical protein
MASNRLLCCGWFDGGGESGAGGGDEGGRDTESALVMGWASVFISAREGRGPWAHGHQITVSSNPGQISNLNDFQS